MLVGQSLFREDSVTSKFLACASNGQNHINFLCNILAPSINAVLDLKYPLEVCCICSLITPLILVLYVKLNPLKIDEGVPPVEKSAEVVKSIVSEIIANLGCYLFTCPM